jgi:glucoamylase
MRVRHLCLWFFIFTSLCFFRPLLADEAPGAPGAPHHWTEARKIGIGTSRTPNSKVWFSLVKGKLSEVYWPTIDTAQLTDMQFLITDGRSFFSEESQDLLHDIRILDERSLSYQQINRDPHKRFTLYKTYITDPDRNVLRIQVTFEAHQPGLNLYLLANPAATNTGLYDYALAAPEALYAWDERALPVEEASPQSQVQAWLVDVGFAQSSAGFVGYSDGWQDLKANYRLDNSFLAASNGNVSLVGKIQIPATTGKHRFDIALGFGHSLQQAKQVAQASLNLPFENRLNAYQRSWHQYLNGLTLKGSAKPLLTGAAKALYYRSLMVLKAHEDKRFPGAMIASLSIPWGTSQFDHHSGDDRGVLPGSQPDGYHDGPVGYHVVWPRDLYQVATAFLVAGDHTTALSALNYLKSVQFTHKDGNWFFCGRSIAKQGAFPQNFWLSGRTHWPGLQLDETAMPILLAWRLWQAQAISVEDYYTDMIKPAADFMTTVGPWTHQERWEEASGISPSSLAAAIAALITAADMAEDQGDHLNAQYYRLTADQWADAVKDWTLTQTGDLAPFPYFIRTEGAGRCNALWNPNDQGVIEIANGGGNHLEKNIIDGGFLELVRLGVLSIDDPDIQNTLTAYDAQIQVDTPQGPAYYRYNEDGYGEKFNGADYDGTGKGRLWPLLTGERGHAALANKKDASSYLNTLAGFANQGLMLPEQVWDKNEGLYDLGEGTGSATPLAWSHAEYIKLAHSIEQQRIVDLPNIVRSRYQSCTTGINVYMDTGLGNDLYLRGSDEPLNWQSGIKARWNPGNRWRIALKGVDHPIQAKALINDHKWQQGKNMRIQPCQENHFWPKF